MDGSVATPERLEIEFANTQNYGFQLVDSVTSNQSNVVLIRLTILFIYAYDKQVVRLKNHLY